MIKVSIIVPIYNAGCRLKECLQTLVDQTLREIEIICVLDCPTDGSEKIAEEFAAKDKRIKLIYNETNLHVAESRNRGIEAACGEYIGFSDHDDVRSLFMYEQLYNHASANLSDVVISNALINNDGVFIEYKYNDISKRGLINSLIYHDDINYIAGAVWASIYKRTLIVDNRIRFLDRRIYLEEDRLYNINVFLVSNRISYLPKAFYVWNKHNDSLSEKWGTEEARTRLAFFNVIYGLLANSNEYYNYKRAFIKSFQNTLHKYYYFFRTLQGSDKVILINLVRKCKFPIVAKYENLKLMSKKRIILYLYVFKLYLNK